MNSLLRLRLIGGDKQAEELRWNERTEDYLDHLCAPLVGIVPYAERQSLRAEAQEHLWALIEDGRAQGLDTAAALEAALREYGEPWQTGQAFVDAWCQRQIPESRLARCMGVAVLRAFAWFGAASVFNLLLLQAYAMVPGWRAAYLPLFSLALLSPVIAGGLTGGTVAIGSTRAVATVVALLSLHSFAAGVLMLPHREGLYFALFQLLFWLPVGCLSAWGTASLVRHLRRSRFLNWAR